MVAMVVQEEVVQGCGGDRSRAGCGWSVEEQGSDWEVRRSEGDEGERGDGEGSIYVARFFLRSAVA